MTLPKFLLSAFSTITILLIGLPIIMMFPTLKTEKATGVAVVAGGITEAIFSPSFWLSAILLLLFFWFMSQIANKTLRVVLFWIPTVSATLVAGLVFAIVSYSYLHRPR